MSRSDQHEASLRRQLDDLADADGMLRVCRGPSMFTLAVNGERVGRRTLDAWAVRGWIVSVRNDGEGTQIYKKENSDG